MDSEDDHDAKGGDMDMNTTGDDNSQCDSNNMDNSNHSTYHA